MSISSIHSHNTSNAAAKAGASDAATLHLLRELVKHIGSRRSTHISNQEMLTSMKLLATVLGELASRVSKMMKDTNATNLGIGQSLIKQATTQLHQVVQQIQAQEAAEHQDHFWNIFAKVVGCIVGAVMIIAGAITSDPGLVVAGLVVIILTTTPLLKDLTQQIATGLSHALVADGVPQAEADRISKVMADIIIVAVVIAATIASGGAGAAGSAAEVGGAGAEEGTEMTTIASENGAEEGAETAATDGSESAAAGTTEETSSINLLTKMRAVGRFLNVFNRLSRTTNLAIAGGSQAISATGLIENTMACIAGGSGKEKKWERDLSTALSILDMIVGVLAGSALAGSASGRAGARSMSKLGRCLAQARGSLSRALPTNLIMNILMKIELLAGCAQASGQLGEAINQMDLGIDQKNLASAQAKLNLFQFANDMNNQSTQNQNRVSASSLKNVNENIGKLSELAQIQEAVAQVLS